MKSKILSILLVMLLAISAVALVSCDSPIELDKPANVRYDGATITWNAVENANSYTVAINDGEAYPVTTNRFPYAAKGQSFSVKITAVSNAEKIVSSGETTMMFFPLEAITELNIASDGTISWAAVENATAYEINVDNVVVDTVSTLSYSGLEAGTHSVKVRPVVQGDNSYYSSWSPAESMTVLGTVAKDDITYTNGNIRWKYVSGAQYYEVRVNGNVVAEKCTTTNVPYNAENLNFEVTVKALGNGSNTFDGAMSEEKAFIFLDTVTNVRVEDGILLWDEVAGADSYKLELNGIVQSNNFTVCEFTKLTPGVDTAIRVMPISNDTTYFSDWSTSKTVRILEAPQIKWNSSLELDGEANNNLYWDLVSNATGYTVRLTLPDKTQVFETFGEIQKAFAYDYMLEGQYTVEVKALAPSTDSNLSDSAYSQPITVTRLDPPERADKNFIVSNPEKVTDGFTVTFKAVSGADKYQLFQDNNLIKTGTAQQFTVNGLVGEGTIEQQTYNFRIQAVGSVDVVNGRTYVELPSLTSKSLSFAITVLAVPTNPVMSGYIYSFGEITGNNGYVVDVSGKPNTSETTSYSLDTLAVGNYQVRVCARGNGAEVLSSNYTGAITVYRLSPPTNIRFVSHGSGGTITYDEVNHAESYAVVFDNDEQPTPVKGMENVIYNRITESGTTVCMQAIANCYDPTNNTVYYMTSPRGATHVFTKLSAPTFGDVAFTNTQLIWKTPGNINTDIYTPTYEVMDGDRNVYVGAKNGTTMDISYLEGGQQYTFKVKAIGDTTSYLDSDESTSITIYKIATPVIERTEDGKYKWNNVINATNYVVYVDGVVVATYQQDGTSAYYYHTPEFNKIKEYTVHVEAVGDNGYNNINSDKAELIQTVKQLSQPEFTVAYTHDMYNHEGEIVATITQESPYATGYCYTIGGASFFSEELSYGHNPNSIGTYSARVYATGGNFDEDGVFYIDSQSTGGSAAYSITLLSVTNVENIKITQQGYITWAVSDDAHGYNIEISLDGGATFTSYETNVNCYTLSAEENQATNIVVRVQAKGNGTNVISSVWVEREVRH